MTVQEIMRQHIERKRRLGHEVKPLDFSKRTPPRYQPRSLTARSA